MINHINGYALALFSLAKEEKKLKDYKKQSLELIEIFKNSEDYLEFLSDKLIDTSKRIDLVEKAFGKLINKNLLHFLFILIERTKIKYAPLVLQKLVKYINKDLHIHEGIVYTIHKISLDELKKLEERTSQVLKIKVTLINKIDTDLIVGFKIVVGDNIIEDSMFSRLEIIKNELLQGKGK